MAQSMFRIQSSSVNEAMQSKLIQNGQYNSNNKIGIDPQSTPLAMGIVRLYYGDKNNKFQPMNLAGILCFIADRKLHSRFLRLYDINNNKLLFQCELYINFNKHFKEVNDYFHCFPTEKIIVGVEFSNVNDASNFKNLINEYSFQGDNIDDIIEEQKQKMGNQNNEISQPYNFERKEHAGWDPETQTFVLNTVPKEIKLLLKKAGFKKKDLKSKETALAIYEILLKEIDFERGKAIQNANRSSYNSDNAQQFKSQGLAGRASKIMGQSQIDQYSPSKQQQNDFFRTQSILNQTQIASPIKGSQQIEENKSKLPPTSQIGNIPPPPIPPPPPIGNFQKTKTNVKQQNQTSSNSPMKQATNTQQATSNLSFTEQLKLQSQNLKKVQETQQSQVKQLSESQQMKLTMNLAVVLEQRKKALMNDQKNSSDVDSDNDNNDSDDSVW